MNAIRRLSSHFLQREYVLCTLAQRPNDSKAKQMRYVEKHQKFILHQLLQHLYSCISIFKRRSKVQRAHCGNAAIECIRQQSVCSGHGFDISPR